MPIYEYECENCGTRFERLQSMQDEPIHQCPECAGSVHKLFHPAGIIFKGSGWYITDSRKATSGAVTGESKPSGGETKTETKADGGKVEAKAEAKTKTESSKAETKTETKSESK
jgi:putative FmdB family regulatory protein